MNLRLCMLPLDWKKFLRAAPYHGFFSSGNKLHTTALLVATNWNPSLRPPAEMARPERDYFW